MNMLQAGTHVKVNVTYPDPEDRALLIGREGYVREGQQWADDSGETKTVYTIEVPSLAGTQYRFLASELDVLGVPDVAVEADGPPPRANVSGGGRKDQGARFDLIPVAPLWDVANLYAAGAFKYAARNWEDGFDWSKSYAALQRHAQRFWMGENDDPETGEPHLAAVVFHAFALMEFGRTHPELDDRPKSGGQVDLATIKRTVVREA